MTSSLEASCLGDRSIPESVISHQNLRKSITTALFYLIRLLDLGPYRADGCESGAAFFDIEPIAGRFGTPRVFCFAKSYFGVTLPQPLSAQQ